MVSKKAVLKLISVMIIVASAVFICSIFLNYSMDVKMIKPAIDAIADASARTIAQKIYEAQISMSKVVLASAGGCMGLVAVIVLMFSIGNFINEHSAELGVLKALGYGENRLALEFWKFGLSVLLGALLGYGFGMAASGVFYSYFDASFPQKSSLSFHYETPLFFAVIPSIIFCGLSILYARLILRKRPLELISGAKKIKINSLTKKLQGKDSKDSFLKGMRRSMLFSNFALIFFVGFAAFGFSDMMQMAIGMTKLNKGDFFMPTVFVGYALILGYLTLVLALQFVINRNKKSIAILKAYGYTDRECSHALFGGYRIVTYIGYAIGTVYQYFFLKIVTKLFVGATVDALPEITFSVAGFFSTLALFIVSYELLMLFYRRRVSKVSLKEIMQQ